MLRMQPLPLECKASSFAAFVITCWPRGLRGSFAPWTLLVCGSSIQSEARLCPDANRAAFLSFCVWFGVKGLRSAGDSGISPQQWTHTPARPEHTASAPTPAKSSTAC